MIATTPINIEQLKNDLSLHSDRQFVKYLIDGLTYGFDTGIKVLPQKSLICNNLKSALQEPDVVTELINTEVQKGYVMGPFRESPFKLFRISPIGIATGKYSGKKRLIVDLSAPHDDGEHDSINNLIDKDEFSLKYVRIDDAMNTLLDLGAGSWMCKFDIADAFKIIPMDPAIWHLYGIKWEGQYYFFKRLTFGCRSSPKIFDTLSRALCWIAQHKYKINHILHLLDDFLTIDDPQCIKERNMAALSHLFGSLAVPISTKKTVGPVHVIEYLGIILDSVKMEARLPADKLTRITEIIDTYMGRKSITKRELLSLLGHLNFACKVIIPGRSFVSHMIDLSTKVTKMTDYIHLSEMVCKELKMWKLFLSQWNGVALFLENNVTLAHDMHLFTDASSTCGFGGYFKGKWFMGEWPVEIQQLNNKSVSMALLELYPIVIASLLWGASWSRKRICFHCDNLATVHILSKRRSKTPMIMKLMRRLTWLAAKHNFFIYSKHIPGVQNDISDALSRFQVNRFRQLAPEAEWLPHPIPNFSEVTLL